MRSQEIPPHEIAGERIQQLIALMKKTLSATPDGIGLAAPQVAEPLRIFLVSEEAEAIDRGEISRHEHPAKEQDESEKHLPEEQPHRTGKQYVFINPAVRKASRKKIEEPEGCLSVPRVFGLVQRHEKITVAAYDETGKPFIRGATRLFARVIQHELDHLNGILFIDRATDILRHEHRRKK